MQNREITLGSNFYTANLRVEKHTHFIRHFLNLKKSRSENTAKSYERDILDFFNVKQVEDVTLDDIKMVNIYHAESYILYLREKKYSSATINRKISSLSSLYIWLLKFSNNYKGGEVISYNPFGSLKEEKPIIVNKETEFLNKTEVKQLLESIDTSTLIGLRNKTILALALTTALRKSELINIKISDVQSYGEYDVINVIRKGGKKDTVKLQPKVKELIIEYLLRDNRELKGNVDSYLFKGHSSNGLNNYKLNPNALNLIISKVTKDAGIRKKLKVHSTRHTAITIAIIEGASAEKIRDFAAHKNLATTNRYIHSVDKIKNNAGDLIDVL
ncbi:MAG: tyrosine-type recombinase/integrase [Clostridium sp.]